MNPNCRIGKVTLKQPANVIRLDVDTYIDVPASRVLAEALDANLDGVVIVGYLNGREYLASSYADGDDCLWLLERARHRLMRVTDEINAA